MVAAIKKGQRIMGGFVSDKDLEYEAQIVWLEDPNKLNWVRESKVDFRTRVGISKDDQPRFEDYRTNKNVCKIVGYANLDDIAPPSFHAEDDTPHFYRRIFTLRASDRPDDPEYNWETDCPTEAVDPLTVSPKTKGISPKKKSQIAVRIPPSLLRKLNSHVKRTGISKTDVVVSALANYLDSAEDMPLTERIVDIEKRLTALEAQKRS